MSRLKQVKEKLSQNPKVDVKVALDNDMTRLEREWMSVEDVAQGSLDTLWDEHSVWINEILETMEELISKGQAILDRQQSFVTSYPLNELLTSNAEDLLKQLQDILTTYDVRIQQCTSSLYKNSNRMITI